MLNPNSGEGYLRVCSFLSERHERRAAVTERVLLPLCLDRRAILKSMEMIYGNAR
jgi:hypothetical protein